MEARGSAKNTRVLLCLALFFCLNTASAQVSIHELNTLLKPRILLAPNDSTSMLFRSKYQGIKADDMPFFCRIEEKWTSKSKINVRFRLGSLEYVDKLESKNLFVPDQHK